MAIITFTHLDVFFFTIVHMLGRPIEVHASYEVIVTRSRFWLVILINCTSFAETGEEV